MLLTLLATLVVVRILFPNDVALYMIPTSVFEIILWLNAYRVSRKKAVESSI